MAHCSSLCPSFSTAFSRAGFVVDGGARSATAADLLAIYKEAYAGEPLVRVGVEPPVVKDNSGKHHVALGGPCWVTALGDRVG